MATVADYSIVLDNWTDYATKDTFPFNVPSNIDPGSRCVLGFMFKVLFADDDLTLHLRMNGLEVWSWSCEGGSFPARFFQEVIPKGAVKPGKNILSAHISCGDLNCVEFSDIVVWWQANI